MPTHEMEPPRVPLLQHKPSCDFFHGTLGEMAPLVPELQKLLDQLTRTADPNLPLQINNTIKKYNDLRGIFRKEYTLEVTVMMLRWMKKQVNEIHNHTPHFDLNDQTGRVTFKGTFQIQSFVEQPYFPHLVDKAEGPLQLPKGIKTLEHLETAQDIYADAADFSALKLKTMKDFFQQERGAESASFPELIKCGDFASHAKRIYCPQLEIGGEMSLNFATELNIDTLNRCETLIIPSLEHFKHDNLVLVSNRFAPSHAITVESSLLVSASIFVAPEATFIKMPSLRFTEQLDISSLDDDIPFRDAFPVLTRVEPSFSDSSVTAIKVKSEKRKQEIQGLIGPKLKVDGAIEIVKNK
jgi:hypothetical protein